MAYCRFMRALLILAAFAVTLAATSLTTAAQDLSFREMRWRDIGPTRAGRARALAGVATQPNTIRHLTDWKKSSSHSPLLIQSMSITSTRFGYGKGTK